MAKQKSALRVPPNAAALIESMRDIGYSLETAIADLIDNSITAGAKKIEIMFDPDPMAPVLGIIDDGSGMTADELVEAMRPGSRSPKEKRSANDLGRFGLGLKTASFSQCRRLTVLTRKGATTRAACWDLDLVEEANDWLLLTDPDIDPALARYADRLGKKGTLVLWEKIDRFADQAGNEQFRDHVFTKMDGVREHLELVFHRFLDGERPFRKLGISINQRPLVAFDPFNSQHKATQRLRSETIKVSQGNVEIEPFILPHHKKVSERDWEKYGGEKGYLRNQGFYVYRAGRLIIHGTWFRLARQSELTKLARVRVDIPNGLDSYWKIDVRKASAQPPYVVRQRLRSIIERITGQSANVYTSKGRRLTAAAGAPVWNRRTDKGQIFYELNREHPVVQGFMEQLEEHRQVEFRSVLQAVERSFPVDAVFSDVAGNPAAVAAPALSDDDLRLLVEIASRSYLERGLTEQDMVDELSPCEPWQTQWAKVKPLIAAIFKEARNG